jgi:hypothetical protein
MTQPRTCRRIREEALFVAALALRYAVVSLASRLLADEPVFYADDEDYFKYGSLGGEREAVVPYWVWRALPHVCADHLPSEGKQFPGVILPLPGTPARAFCWPPFATASTVHRQGLSSGQLTC